MCSSHGPRCPPLPRPSSNARPPRTSTAAIADMASMVADMEEALAIETARSGQATGEVTAVLRTLPAPARACCRGVRATPHAGHLIGAARRDRRHHDRRRPRHTHSGTGVAPDVHSARGHHARWCSSRRPPAPTTHLALAPNTRPASRASSTATSTRIGAPSTTSKTSSASPGSAWHSTRPPVWRQARWRSKRRLQGSARAIYGSTGYSTASDVGSGGRGAGAAAASAVATG